MADSSIKILTVDGQRPNVLSVEQLELLDIQGRWGHADAMRRGRIDLA